MLIRPEQHADADAIDAVHPTGFPMPLKVRLVDALWIQAACSCHLSPSMRAMIVGHVAFSPGTAEGAANGVGLGPVAVVASHRRRGIAVEIIRRGLALQSGGLWLGGRPR